MMQHPSHGDLDRYRLNELGAKQRAAVRHHLICCTRCARILVEAARLTDLVRALIASEAIEEFVEAD